MHGVDVDGEFPYDTVQDYAKAHGQTALLDRLDADTQTEAEAETRLIADRGVAATLRYFNDPERLKGGNAFYRSLLKLGDGGDQPGAALMTAWYKRNFLICANLIQLRKAGGSDGGVLRFAGHAFLLRQCVQETPGFKLVEPNAYLPR